MIRCAICLLLVMSAGWAAGEEPAAPIPKFDFADAAKNYRLSAGKSDRECTSMQVDLLKWTNPVRGTKAGSVFLWTHDGVPQAACCMYAYHNQGSYFVDHELVSLSTERIEARYDGDVVWHCEKPGIVWTTWADAPVPSAKRPARLVQMRTLAASLTGHLGTALERKDDLRLLSQSVYRYPESEAEDGAVFAFVQTTDPEILLLRANLKDEKPIWEFSATRMTMVNCFLAKDDKVVWSVPWWQKNSDDTYLTRARVSWSALEN